MIGSGDVALLLAKTQHGTVQGRQAQTRTQRKGAPQEGRPDRKETDQQTSSKAVFNCFQLGFWVGALVVRRLGTVPLRRESLPPQTEVSSSWIALEVNGPLLGRESLRQAFRNLS